MDPQEIELLTRVASLYYLEDATQAEIAERLNFSRPKVARMLQKARGEGIVEIKIRTHPALNMELEAAFKERFGLTEAILVADQPTVDDQRTLVGRAAAASLARTLEDQSVVAVGMGRNVSAVAEELTDASARDCSFVSAIGGSHQVGTGVNSNDISFRFAAKLGAQAVTLYAPAYADSSASRRAFLAHTDVRETLDRARGADFAVVGIGDARDDSAVVQMGCFSTKEMARMRKAGAVGDILGFFFDAEGAAVAGSVGNRVVGLSDADLRAIPHVMAVVGEHDKYRAVHGALRTKIVDVLVTNVRTAERVLSADGVRPVRGRSKARGGLSGK